MDAAEPLRLSSVVDVPDDEAAKMWAGKVAEGCGWPHEIRRFKPQPRFE